MNRIALLGCIAAASAAHAAEPWREASSAHFVIYAQQPEERLRAYAEQLERFDAALHRVFPARSGDEEAIASPLTIYALRDDEAVRKVMGISYSGVAGVYRENAAGSLALTSWSTGPGSSLDGRIVLQHEYAHHFMLHNFSGAYPRWFVEGFAEFASTARAEKDGGVGLGIPARHRAIELQYGRAISMRKMLGDERSRRDTVADGLYSYGWLLTHYLMFEPSRSGQLARYLARINDGTRPAKAAEEAFGDLNKLGSDVDAYMARSKMSYLALGASVIKASPVRVRTLSAAENAIMPVRIESKYGVDQKEAQRLVAPARLAATPYPNDVAAQCMLAEAEDDARNLDASAAAVDRALATNPKAYCALLYKGRNEMRRAEARSAPADDPQWAAARGWFSKANRAQIQNPLPMFLYYQTFKSAKAKPTANAVDALLGAALRAPQDPELRVAAAAQLLRDRRPDQARMMLGPVANAAHGGDGADWLRALYARIGTDDPATLADTLLAGPPKPTQTAAK